METLCRLLRYGLGQNLPLHWGHFEDRDKTGTLGNLGDSSTGETYSLSQETPEKWQDVQIEQYVQRNGI